MKFFFQVSSFQSFNNVLLLLFVVWLDGWQQENLEDLEEKKIIIIIIFEEKNKNDGKQIYRQQCSVVESTSKISICHH